MINEKRVRPATRAAWRKWLERHHDGKREIWVVFRRVAPGKRSLTYAEAVEEALCFGWIDTTRRALDDESYIQRFTPRSNMKNWSQINLDRFAKMDAAGLMTDAGRAKKPRGVKPPARRFQAGDPIPEFVLKAVNADAAAKKTFDDLPPGYKRDYIRFITEAKQEETRLRRLEEALRHLRNGVRAIFRAS